MIVVRTFDPVAVCLCIKSSSRRVNRPPRDGSRRDPRELDRAILENSRKLVTPGAAREIFRCPRKFLRPRYSLHGSPRPLRYVKPALIMQPCRPRDGEFEFCLEPRGCLPNKNFNSCLLVKMTAKICIRSTSLAARDTAKWQALGGDLEFSMFNGSWTEFNCIFF